MRLRSIRKPDMVMIIIALSLSIAACGTSAKQQTAIALDNLQKIQAALKVKVSHENYSQLITDAQFQVDKAVSALPDGELKNELKGAMEAYREAKWAWDISSQAPVSNGPESFMVAASLQDTRISLGARENQTKAKELLKKYSLISGTESDTDLNLLLISTKDVLQSIWRTAHQHVERAKSLNS